MPKAYKITSDPFFVNGNVTESAVDTFTQTQISLPLDSLNREGVLIHGVYFTSSEPNAVLGANTSQRVQLTSTSKTGLVNANDANLVARQEKFIYSGTAEFAPITWDFIGQTAPYGIDDNLMIVATDDIFLGIQGNQNTSPRSAQVRVVCSRIQLEASAYAALVTNELSS
jgi:hypothetical protein